MLANNLLFPSIKLVDGCSIPLPLSAATFGGMRVKFIPHPLKSQPRWRTDELRNFKEMRKAMIDFSTYMA